MQLSNKTILIISPQPWEGLKLSKHHYAEELVKLGNEVYFLPPPIRNIKSIKIFKLSNGVQLIEHGHFFPYNLFFHFRWLYMLLLKMHVKLLMKHMNDLDLVWSFDGLRFLNLRSFKAKYYIYHPVDIQKDDYFTLPAKTADIVISVTSEILAKFSCRNTHKIGHGVSKKFIKLFDKEYRISEDLNFCYTGNLTMHGVDFEEIIKVVEKSKHINFHFIGPFESYSPEGQSYIRFLQNQKNVKLYGLLKEEEILKLYPNMDGFMVCYNIEKEQNGGANSHKILEYLSTGKIILSSPIKEYANKIGLLETPNDNETYSEMFLDRVGKLDIYNSSEKMLLRHQYARKQTYYEQIQKISSILE